MISEEILRKSSLDYLNGLRVPATLLAGSSLAALFTSINKAGTDYKNNDIRSILLVLQQQQQQQFVFENPDNVEHSSTNSGIIPNRYNRIVELIAFRIYYVSCFISLLMSLVTIIYTTVGGTRLLLTTNYDDKSNMLPSSIPQDAYNYMKYTIELNFVVSRWSSIVSIIFFFILITFRTILEFRLLYPPRMKVGLSILFLMITILFNLSAHVNETLSCFPNLFVMTLHVLKLLSDVIAVQPKIVQVSSLLTVTGFVTTGLWSFLSSLQSITQLLLLEKVSLSNLPSP